MHSVSQSVPLLPLLSAPTDPLQTPHSNPISIAASSKAEGQKKRKSKILRQSLSQELILEGLEINDNEHAILANSIDGESEHDELKHGDHIFLNLATVPLTDISMVEWLREHNIKRHEILSKFVESEMSVSELLTYSAHDIDDLILSYRIKSPYKKRFKDAVLKLQREHKAEPLAQRRGSALSPIPPLLHYLDASNPGSPSQVQRVIVSFDEEECGKKLDEKLREIVRLQLECKQTQSRLQCDGRQCAQHIQSVFAVLRSILRQREDELMQLLQCKLREQAKEMHDRQQLLINYEQIVMTAKQQYEELLMDASLDRYKREKQIANLTDNALHSYDHIVSGIHASSLPVDGDERMVHLDLDTNEIGERLLKLGHIEMCATANPPQIAVSEITHCSAKIKLICKHFAADGHRHGHDALNLHTINEQRNAQCFKVEIASNVAHHSKNKLKRGDQEGLRWREITNSHSMQRLADNEWMLHGLGAAQVYCLRACTKQQHGWSAYSKTTRFSTACMMDSCLLKHREQKLMLKMLANQHVCFDSMKLLYRASRDGFSAKVFHAKCDGYSNTITLVKTDKNRVFGGFACIPWSCKLGYKRDESAFLFVVRHERKLKLSSNVFKLRPHQSMKALYHSAEAGPIFGEGFDLFISNNCHKKMQNISNPKTYCLLPRLFGDGLGNDRIVDYEVFHLSQHLKTIPRSAALRKRKTVNAK